MGNAIFVLGEVWERMSKPLRIAGWISAIFLAVYWVALFVATHVPRVPLPAMSNGDKLAHLGAYCVLGMLVAATLAIRGVSWPKVVGLAIAICSIYGAFDEVSQLAVAGRTADVADWLADFAGATIGIAAFCLAAKFFRMFRSEPASPEPS